jgi:penicillin-binding protein 2
MARAQQPLDWHDFVNEHSDSSVVESTRHRLRWLVALFGLASLLVLGRAIQLEVRDGTAFREIASQPVRQKHLVAAPRGRILARDGTVLAADRSVRAVALEYRYLQDPPDAKWLRRMARARLARAQRNQPGTLEQTQRALRDEIAAMHARLARLSGLDEAEWRRRISRVESRVQTLAERIDRQRFERFESRQIEAELQAAEEDSSFTAILCELFAPPEPLPPPAVVLAEQRALHPILHDPPPELVQAIERRPSEFPGVQLVEYAERRYPGATLAAHLIGHVSARSGLTFRADQPKLSASEAEPIGLLGIERQLESHLRGNPGLRVETVDQRGRLLALDDEHLAVPGHDVVLTIDPELQAAAERLLDSSIAKLQKQSHKSHEEYGAAAVVMDVRTGELLVAASAARFDPNAFAIGSLATDEFVRDERRPLFDRVTKMAIPPGSIIKPLVALALVDNKVLHPSTEFRCQGYWEDPDHLRCQIFKQHGVGHNDVTLVDALAQSCNVYFFHHVARLGAQPMADWLAQWGFGQRTGVELPDEAAGTAPDATTLAQLGQRQLVAIGQGQLTATPLQIARAYAALANGGNLLAPKVVRADVDQGNLKNADGSESGKVSSEARIEFSPEARAAVEDGLRRSVNDPTGTAYESARVTWATLAGKTGTAETGSSGDHSWFAGYLPVQAPRFAVVVAIEHGGSSAVAAALARNLLQHMRELGYFPSEEIAEKSLPDGKG